MPLRPHGFVYSIADQNHAGLLKGGHQKKQPYELFPVFWVNKFFYNFLFAVY